MFTPELPQQKCIYQNHFLDSTFWDGFTPREDDVVIATSLKAGTTWMQTILANLVFQDQEIPEPVWQLSPWIDFRAADIQEKLAGLEKQVHRRFVKTHLPLDGLKYFPQVKYIYVGRDGRDIFMSLWNHHNILSKELVEKINGFPNRVGDPFPTGPDDVHEFFHDWITRGWFAWEREGYPYWSILHHAQTWFDFRQLDNILLIHFNDLLDDLEGEMYRIAKYLEIKVDDQFWPVLVNNATFRSMKRNSENVVPGGGSSFSGRFLFKGTNGRWMNVLSPDELALFEKTVAEVVTPECARWLEHGRSAFQ